MFPELLISSYWVTIKFGSVVLQVMAYAQQSRESSKHEQAALNERMQECKGRLIKKLDSP